MNKEISEETKEQFFSKEWLEHMENDKDEPTIDLKTLDNGDWVFVNAEGSLEITIPRPKTRKEKGFYRSITNNFPESFIEQHRELHKEIGGGKLTLWELGFIAFSLDLFSWKGEIVKNPPEKYGYYFSTKPILLN